MSQHELFPPVTNVVPMARPYREAFERLVSGTLKPGDREALRAYILGRERGRLAALNAVRELRSHHLDELMKANK
jgi:hypothetical protein